MFSLDAPAGGNTATRNPRRRQRTTSDDSLALRQSSKRRKRSFLTPDTFLPPNQLKPNGHLPAIHGAPVSNGHPPEARKHRDVSVDTTSLAIRNRGSKKIDRDRRVSKQEEGVVQVGISRTEIDYLDADIAECRRRTTTTLLCKIQTSQTHYETF